VPDDLNLEIRIAGEQLDPSICRRGVP